MNKIINFINNDLKNIFRDKTLTLIFVVPVIIICLLRFGIPILAKELPLIIDYYQIIIAVFATLCACFPAFLISFIMMDEKDEDIVTVLRIMPFSYSRLIIYRLFFLFILGFIFSFFTILFSNLIVVKFFNLLLLSFLCSLISPISALFAVTFAKNKIECTVFLKALGFVLFIPIASYFIDSPLNYIFGIFPVFWTFQSFIFSSSNFYLFISIGLIFHFILIYIFFSQFKKRII